MPMNMVCVLAIAIALVLVLQISSPQGVEAASSRAKVEMLPGFEGPLPFQLETGYVGLGEKDKDEDDDDDDMQVFYYFTESENNPQKDPLILWITGGPACSAFSDLAYQVGPIKFKVEEYINGSLPNLVLRPQSWTKLSSIIFVDLPFGTGFSYAKNLTGLRSDWKVAHHAHQFLRKWLIDHPEFISNELYVAAVSYAGIPAPAIVQEISNGNDRGLQPWINIQGYLQGNTLTTRREKNYQISFAHGMGLISDELYLSLQRNCKGEYLNIDSTNVLCSRDMHSYNKCLSGLFLVNILGTYCADDEVIPNFPDQHKLLYRRSLAQPLNSQDPTIPEKNCPGFLFFLAEQWANDPRVREALHIRERPVKKWERCHRTDYESDIPSSFEIHVNLSAKGYRSLIYNGDHDMLIPFMAAEAWIRALNYSIVDDWRQWLVNGQVAGYTRTYSNKMTFATVKGAGHTAVEDKPDQGFAMFSRWISNEPL